MFHDVLMLLILLLVHTSCLVLLVTFFFFQAEDGIRDLVRSRGLGDVYKRQDVCRVRRRRGPRRPAHPRGEAHRLTRRSGRRIGPVSYTHLTLPTSDLV